MSLVSVIVPVYNIEQYLNICMDSILAQSYHSLQIVLVDDGSTDNSGVICDEYAAKDPRVTVIHKENGGLSDARNAGIEIVKGEYVTFVDSDDMLNPRTIEYLIDLITEYNGDISVCQSMVVQENDFDYSQFTNNSDEIIQLSDNLSIMHHLLSNKYLDVTAWGKLYRTTLFKDIRFPIGKYHEDIFTTYRIFGSSNKVIIGFIQYYYYRSRQGSIMKSSFSPKHLDGIEGMVERSEYVRKIYPSEYGIACSGIVYMANQCLFRMALSSVKETDYVDLLQECFRKYEWSYLLCSNGRLLSKLMSIMAYLNVRCTIRIIAFINRLLKVIY